MRVFSLSLSTMSLAVVSKVLLRWSNVRVRAEKGIEKWEMGSLCE